MPAFFHPSGPTFLDLARQALSGTAQGYDQLAPRFNYTPFRTPDEVVAAVVGVATADGPVAAAVDLCCGTGAGLAALRPRVTERLVGIDFSAGMLREADAAMQRTEGVPVDLVHADVRDYPFTASFDVVTCFGAFGHFRRADEPVLARQIASALRPGGRFVFVTTDRVWPTSRRWWASRGFNAAMRVRNLAWRPRFEMSYLRFQLPRAERLLSDVGLEVEVVRGALPAPYEAGVIGIARRR